MAIIDIVVDIRFMGLLLVQVGIFFVDGFMVFHDGCCMGFLSACLCASGGERGQGMASVLLRCQRPTGCHSGAALAGLEYVGCYLNHALEKI